MSASLTEQDPLVQERGKRERGGKRSRPNRGYTCVLVTVVILFGLVAGIALFALVRTFTEHPAPPSGLPVCTSNRVSGETALSERWDCYRLLFDYTSLQYTDRRNPTDKANVGINPTDPLNLIATGSQGWFAYWSSIVAWRSIDGGASWTASRLPRSRCMSTSTIGSEDDYIFIGDPVNAFSIDGTAYAVSLGFNIGTDPDSNNNEGVVAWKSVDGGATWSPPISVSRDDGYSNYQDRPTMYVDPYDADKVFVIWSDIPENWGILDANSIKIRRSFDGMTSFKDPLAGKVVYYDRDVPGYVTDSGLFSLGCTLHRHPHSKNLIFVCMHGSFLLQDINFVVVISTDDGDTWSAPSVPHPAVVSEEARLPPASYRNGGLEQRAQYEIKSTISQKTGYLYATFAQSESSTGNSGSDVYITMSKDGGITWTPYKSMNPELSHTVSMNPYPAVSADGNTVAVQYYNDRHNTYSAGSTYDLDVYVTFFDANLNRLGEHRVTPTSFDQLASNHPLGAADAFLGDYHNFVAHGHEFHGVYVATEADYRGVHPVPSSGAHSVDRDDRQNLYHHKTSASCMTRGPPDVPYPPPPSMLVRNNKKHTDHSKRATMTPEEKFEYVMTQWERERGKLASKMVGPKLSTAFNVTYTPTGN